MDNRHQNYETLNIRQEVSETDSFTPTRYEQFFRCLPAKTVSVLDIGCNTGRGGKRLKELNPAFEIIGLDCVSERLNSLPECYSRRLYGLSTDIPLEDQSVDAITAGEFLEHLYPADVDKTLCEFQRVLKTRGRLLMTTPNPYYLKNRLLGLSVYGTSHLTQHFPEILRIRLQMHGFSKVRIYGSGRVSKFLGRHFPFLSVYGSYLIKADKY